MHALWRHWADMAAWPQWNDGIEAITVDGGNIRNPVEGGTGQNFSQEVVQEFQISTANFDLSTGIAAFGAINVVTRSGSNAFRGAGYVFAKVQE